MKRIGALSLLVIACAQPSTTPQPAATPDTVAIKLLAKDLASDVRRGRGPWAPETAEVARLLADMLRLMGATPLVGNSILVPFTVPTRPQDTVYNVAAILPGTDKSATAELIGVTAHFDHLGVGRPDSTGDNIYNGFTDDAIGVAMVMDVARRFRLTPGHRSLAVMLFNLEEQGLLGARAFVQHTDVAAILPRLKLLVGIDAGTPGGEALSWQLMGGAPAHAGTRIADSLARARGWVTTLAVPRGISDVFPFSQRGVPILFPIPQGNWKGFDDAQMKTARATFDHYHQPGDQWRADFPMLGTWHFADWAWNIVQVASDARQSLQGN